MTADDDRWLNGLDYHVLFVLFMLVPLAFGVFPSPWFLALFVIPQVLVLSRTYDERRHRRRAVATFIVNTVLVGLAVAVYLGLRASYAQA
jgi:4-hydroxybenzoate polyprenyltransferase